MKDDEQSLDAESEVQPGESEDETPKLGNGWAVDEEDEDEKERDKDSAPAKRAVAPRRKGPVAGIRVCTACGSGSDAVTWESTCLAHRQGQTVEVPDGDWCLPCANAGDAFPKLDREAVMAKLKLPEFRSECQAARGKAEGLPEQQYPAGHVFGQSTMGIRIETECRA